MSFRKTLIAAIVSALTLASAAVAHIEITDVKVARDRVVVFTLNVPAERKVPTVKLEVKVPLEKVSAVKKSGWKVVVRGGIVTWSGGRIAPGKSTQFRLAGRVPKSNELAFPTLQTYADGTVVHWIGPPSSDEPAPRVTLHMFALPVTTSAPSENENHHGLWLGVGIGVAVAGLALVGVAAVRRRRT